MLVGDDVLEEFARLTHVRTSFPGVHVNTLPRYVQIMTTVRASNDRMTAVIQGADHASGPFRTLSDREIRHNLADLAKLNQVVERMAVTGGPFDRPMQGARWEYSGTTSPLSFLVPRR